MSRSVQIMNIYIFLTFEFMVKGELNIKFKLSKILLAISYHISKIYNHARIYLEKRNARIVHSRCPKRSERREKHFSDATLILSFTLKMRRGL